MGYLLDKLSELKGPAVKPVNPRGPDTRKPKPNRGSADTSQAFVKKPSGPTLHPDRIDPTITVASNAAAAASAPAATNTPKGKGSTLSGRAERARKEAHDRVMKAGTRAPKKGEKVTTTLNGRAGKAGRKAYDAVIKGGSRKPDKRDTPQPPPDPDFGADSGLFDVGTGFMNAIEPPTSAPPHVAKPIIQVDHESMAKTAEVERVAQERRNQSPTPGMHPDRALGLDSEGNAPVTPFFKPGVWDEKVVREKDIKAANDRNGGARVAMGEIDPDANNEVLYRADDARVGPQTRPGINKIASLMTGNISGIYEGMAGAALDPEHWKNPDAGHISDHLAAPAVDNLMSLRDIHGRLAQARRWMVDDPENDKDDPVMQYTTPHGNVRTTEDIAEYYDIGDGVARTGEQLADVKPNFASGSPLDALKKVSKAELEPGGNYVETEDGQLWEVPGGYSGDNIITSSLTGVPYALPDKYDKADLAWDDQGKGYLTKEIVFGDGSVHLRKNVDGKTPKYLGRGFDDGTYLRDAAGNETDYGRNADVRQIQGDHIRKSDAIFNMGIRDPRAPWQDTTGRNAWDEGYDKNKSAWNEIAPYMTDMALGSAPYFIPYYGALAGLADATPYVMGYDGESYNPKGKWFDNPGQLGMGNFADRTLTRSQQFGGVGSAIMNALLERAAGPAIGISGKAIPKWAKASRVGAGIGKFAATPVGKPVVGVGGAILSEGPIEEGPNVLVDRFKTDKVGDYGKSQGWNTEQGKYTYRQDESPLQRAGNLNTDFWTASGGGALLGGFIGGAKELKAGAIPTAMWAVDKFGRPRPKNATGPVKLEPGIGASLEVTHPERVQAEPAPKKKKK